MPTITLSKEHCNGYLQKCLQCCHLKNTPTVVYRNASNAVSQGTLSASSHTLYNSCLQKCSDCCYPRNTVSPSMLVYRNACNTVIQRTLRAHQLTVHNSCLQKCLQCCYVNKLSVIIEDLKTSCRKQFSPKTGTCKIVKKRP